MATAPTLNDVVEKIAVVFPDRDPQAVLAVLDRYGTEKHEQECRRVQLAILKLCDETESPDLERTVEHAKQDFRDILMWAEYPNMTGRHGIKDKNKRQKLADRDQAQYLAWLNKR